MKFRLVSILSNAENTTVIIEKIVKSMRFICCYSPYNSGATGIYSTVAVRGGGDSNKQPIFLINMYSVEVGLWVRTLPP